MAKFTLTLAGIAVALTLVSSLAQAQGHEHHGSDELLSGGQQQRSPKLDRQTHPNFKSGQNPGRRLGHYKDDRFDQRTERWNDRGDGYNARGPEFRRGGYIPRHFYNPSYFVNDYHLHRLPPPPRNHRWVQVGTDYVLIAIATGIIANIILNY